MNKASPPPDSSSPRSSDPPTVERVYISSLANAESKDSEPGEKHIITRDAADIDAFVQRWNRKGRGLFFCVSTIAPAAIRRAKDTLAELTGLHADIDFKSVDAAPDEIERALGQLRLLPSYVICSGNGFHVYYVFREGIEASPENKARVEAALRLLADHLGGDLQCAEAARLMRLPGSHNTKNDAWTEVRTIVDPHPPRRFELDDLEEWLSEVSPVIRRKAAAAADEPPNPFLAIASQLGFKPPIDVEERLRAMAYQGSGETAIHPTQLAVSAALLTRGEDSDAVVALLLDATRAAAGAYAERWNWAREERALRKMCETWLAKHPPDLEARATGTNEGETPNNVVPLKRKDRAGQKTSEDDQGETGKVKKAARVVADGVIRIVRDRGGDLLLTGGDLHIYRDGVWHPATAGDEQWLRVLIQQGCEAVGRVADVRTLNAAWKRLYEHPGLFHDNVAWNTGTHLALQNGVLEVRTGVFTEWRPDYFLTRKLGVAYDRFTQCPRLLEILASMFHGCNEGAEIIALLQEFCGAALAIGLLDREQRRMLILVGPSRTGKTELARIIARLVGEPIAAPMCKDIGDRFGRAAFLGATAWIRDDAVNEGDRVDPALMKALVTGETIEVQRKNKPAVSFVPRLPIVLTTNALPAARDSSDAAFNRSLVVDMTNVISEEQAVAERRRLGIASGSSLGAWIIEQEGPGVLNWALTGLTRLLERGRFTIPQSVSNAIRQLQGRQQLGFRLGPLHTGPSTRHESHPRRPALLVPRLVPRRTRHRDQSAGRPLVPS